MIGNWEPNKIIRLTADFQRIPHDLDTKRCSNFSTKNEQSDVFWCFMKCSHPEEFYKKTALGLQPYLKKTHLK